MSDWLKKEQELQNLIENELYLEFPSEIDCPKCGQPHYIYGVDCDNPKAIRCRNCNRMFTWEC